MAPTVWNTGGCASWYQDDHGRNPTLWPDFTWKFVLATRRFDIAAYDVVRHGEAISDVAPLTDAAA